MGSLDENFKVILRAMNGPLTGQALRLVRLSGQLAISMKSTGKNQRPDATFPSPETARNEAAALLAAMQQKCHRGMPEYEISVTC